MDLALGYSATLALIGWVLWLRDRRAETVKERLAALDHRTQGLAENLAEVGEAVSLLSVNLNDARSIVDNLAMKSGLTPRR